MCWKRLKERPVRVTAEQVIATRDMYSFGNYPGENRIDFRKYTTESWHQAGREIEQEILRDAYACCFAL